MIKEGLHFNTASLERKGGEGEMAINEVEVIEKLKLERGILADGGYGRSVRTPWRATEYFRDSITCPNMGETEKIHPCSECFLINYVHPRYKDTELPCHFIPLNAEGDTIDSLQREGNLGKLEQLLLAWLDNQIQGLKQA
jgi:hypothetical protein